MSPSNKIGGIFNGARAPGFFGLTGAGSGSFTGLVAAVLPRACHCSTLAASVVAAAEGSGGGGEIAAVTGLG